MVVAVLIFASQNFFFVNASSDFSDVSRSHWAYKYINTARENGWITGVGNNRFAPERQVSYAEWLTMIANVYFMDFAEDYDSFPSGSQWYERYLDIASYFDLLEYVDADVMRTPNAPCSRNQMANIISATLAALGGSPRNDSDSQALRRKYDDASQASFGMAECVELGIITGTSKTKLSPLSSMTRAQAATVLCNIDQAVKSHSSYFAYEPDLDLFRDPDAISTPIEESAPWPPSEADKQHMRDAVTLYDRTTHGLFNFEFYGEPIVLLDARSDLYGYRIKGNSIQDLENRFVDYARAYFSEDLIQEYSPYISECAVCINGTCYSTWLGEWARPNKNTCTFFKEGNHYIMRHEYEEGPITIDGFYDAIFAWQNGNYVLVDYREAK